jgi:hypothetical protein
LDAATGATTTHRVAGIAGFVVGVRQSSGRALLLGTASGHRQATNLFRLSEVAPGPETSWTVDLRSTDLSAIAVDGETAVAFGAERLSQCRAPECGVQVEWIDLAARASIGRVRVARAEFETMPARADYLAISTGKRVRVGAWAPGRSWSRPGEPPPPEPKHDRVWLATVGVAGDVTNEVYVSLGPQVVARATLPLADGRALVSATVRAASKPYRETPAVFAVSTDGKVLARRDLALSAGAVETILTDPHTWSFTPSGGHCIAARFATFSESPTRAWLACASAATWFIPGPPVVEQQLEPCPSANP